jgi:hypothetical protein
MAAAAILKLYCHFRYCDFQTQHVFLSLCTNLHENQVVIAHLTARSSISNMAAAAILKIAFTSGIMNFELSMFFLVCVNCPFYSIHLNFQHGGGSGHLESGRSLPVLHF